MAMRFDEVTWMQAEILWANCGAELVYSIQDFQDLQYCNDDKALIGKQRIIKAIHVQDPHVKKIILDCLRVKHIVLSDVRKNKPTRKWYVEYLVSFLHKANGGPTRRKLAEGSVSNEMVVVVVIVTAVVTLCLAGLLFYCYIRKCVVSDDVSIYYSVSDIIATGVWILNHCCVLYEIISDTVIIDYYVLDDVSSTNAF
ncbi:formin, FH2 domain-containing protein [Artemisia annua]|uniref:Formin, FH2 domain-containing protein n=1 Tax=Artemisia annua TaxID=35608 RepID=A0A2U1NKK7_ARTAN|nr:formin, FH2 domain-containing protein [Artemisia annua]